MVKRSAGKIIDDLYALGTPDFPVYLLKGKEPVLFDAGMTFMGPRYLEDLKASLGNPPTLAHLFLTHSHFDHSGAAPFLKRSIPGLKVAASGLAGEIFKRPNAVKLIQSLSQGMEEKFHDQIGDRDVTFQGLNLDRTFEDGETVELKDGTRIQVISTPGHTRDSVSYYIPHRKALVAGEAVGMVDRESAIRPVFLSSCDDYLDSLEKLRSLEVQILLFGHLYFVVEEAQEMIVKAIESTRALARRIEQELEAAGGDQEAVVQKIFQEERRARNLMGMEERPILLNLAAQVKAIGERKKRG
jgi:glyoxylase-like metal-dependent hydrolase (beta-lactamase superfamily II)